jgi:hypothetical protein
VSPVPFGSTGAQRFTAAPAVGVAGSTYYNTTSSILYVSDGSQWVAIATGGMGVAVSDEGTPLQGSPIQALNFVGLGVEAKLSGPNAGVVNIHDGPFLAPVRLVTTGNVTLSGLTAIDGVTPSAGDRIGVFYQSTGSQNGVYVAAAGSWSRASDVNSAASMAKNTRVWCLEGVLNGGKEWTQVNQFTTLGTDTAVWRVHTVIDAVNALSYPPPYGAGHMVWDTSSQMLRGWDGGAWKCVNGVITCTSSTRPNQPNDGNIIYESDTGLSYIRSAGAWVRLGAEPDPLAVNEIRTKKIDYNPAGSGDILMGASINLNGNTLYGAPTPANSDWVATKGYVDSRDEVRVAAAAPTVAAGNPELWVDTSVTAASDSILALLENPPRCTIQRTAAFAVGANALAPVSWDTEAMDPFNMWVVGSPSRITITTAGLYHLDTAFLFGTVTNNVRLGVAFYVNGVAMRNSMTACATGAAVGPALSADLQLAAADYVEVWAYTTLAASIAASVPTYNFVNVRWVCP